MTPRGERTKARKKAEPDTEVRMSRWVDAAVASERESRAAVEADGSSRTAGAVSVDSV